MNERNTRLSGQVYLKVVVCLFVLGVFFWALILPQMEKLDALGGGIAEAQAVIQRQNKLFPLYAKLTGELGRADLSMFPESQGEPLGLERISEIPQMLGDLAKAHGLEVRAVTPSPDSLDSASRTLPTHAVFLGDLSSVRRFLFTLGSVEYVERLGSMRFEDVGGRTMLSMKAYIALAGRTGGDVGKEG